MSIRFIQHLYEFRTSQTENYSLQFCLLRPWIGGSAFASLILTLNLEIFHKKHCLLLWAGWTKLPVHATRQTSHHRGDRGARFSACVSAVFKYPGHELVFRDKLGKPLPSGNPTCNPTSKTKSNIPIHLILVYLGLWCVCKIKMRLFGHWRCRMATRLSFCRRLLFSGINYKFNPFVVSQMLIQSWEK